MTQRLVKEYMAASLRLAELRQAYQQAIDVVENAPPPQARNRWKTPRQLHQALLEVTRAKQEAEQAFQVASQALIEVWCRRGDVVVLTDRLPDRSAGYDIVSDRLYVGRQVIPGKAQVVGHPAGIVLIKVEPVTVGSAWLVVGDRLKAVYHADLIYPDCGCGAILQVWQDGRWQENGQLRTVRHLARARAA